MGIEGAGKVLSVSAVEPFSPVLGDYRVVTGKFIHDGAEVLDLYFNSGTDDPLGVTAGHPIWSVTREAWVPAAGLKMGEAVYSLTGNRVTITDIRKRPGTYTVYNLEVYQDHVFYVSNYQILVHNSCAVKPRLYEGNSKHGKSQRGKASPAPTNPEMTLKNAVEVKEGKLIGVDAKANEIVVFREHREGKYHGYTSTWKELDNADKALLRELELVNKKGEILKR